MIISRHKSLKKRLWLKQAVFSVLLVFVLVPVGYAYQHHNSKVEFREYSQEAFEEARLKKRPLLAIFSASWCYWCKVYQKQTLDRQEVATFLNRRFIPVFVDLDQRQDLQHLYANKALPTTVIFDPNGEEFLSFSGTLSKNAFLDGLNQVLDQIGRGSRPHKEEKVASVRDVREFLSKTSEPKGGWKSLVTRQREAFFSAAIEAEDSSAKGFGIGKKFPLGAVQTYLLAKGIEQNAKGDARAIRKIVTENLKQIYTFLLDPVEGGFYRYSDSRNWNRPRYEKMLSTNAELLLAFQTLSMVDEKATGMRPEDISKTFDSTLDYVFNNIYSPSIGGFFGSQDGKNPKYFKLDLQGRRKIKSPAVDKTIYTAGNGEAVFSFGEILRQRKEPRIEAAVKKTVGTLHQKLFSADRGFASYFKPKDGKPQGEGLLVDNSWGALALATGMELTGAANLRQGFDSAVRYNQKHLYIPKLGVYRLWNIPLSTSMRKGEEISNEIPLEFNSVMALALVRAYRATGNERYRKLAAGILSAFQDLEPQLFEDDPNDVGKQFFKSYVFYLNALEEFVNLSSKPTA